MNKLKKGWKSDILGNVAELQRGFDLPSAKRINGNIPIISSGGISGYHNEPKVSAPGVVTGRYGTIGSVFYIEEDFWPLNTSLWVKNFFGNNPKFVYYLLSNIDFKKFSDKTGVPGVNRNELHSIKVNIPPLNEQIKIAETLSTWDKAIQTTEKLIENSRQQKKALMQEVLNQNNPRWKQVKLSDIAVIKKGKALSSKDLIDGNYPVIAGGKVSPYNHNDYTNENVITVSASGAYAGFISYHPYKIWASDCSVISSKENSDIVFIFQMLLSFQDKIYSLQSGGAQPHIYPKDLENLKLQVPLDIKEQQKIAEILSSADQEIETLQHKLECLKLEKKALMQRLL